MTLGLRERWREREVKNPSIVSSTFTNLAMLYCESWDLGVKPTIKKKNASNVFL